MICDSKWMQYALEQANLAAAANEVPVGAVVVIEQQIVAAAFNQPRARSDPSAHAEVLALRLAAEKINNYRLVGAHVYVTLEPCLMCAGLMVHARIAQLTFGAYDPRTGAVCSRAHTLDADFLNHRISYRGGVMAKECGEILTQFFQGKR